MSDKKLAHLFCHAPPPPLPVFFLVLCRYSIESVAVIDAKTADSDDADVLDVDQSDSETSEPTTTTSPSSPIYNFVLTPLTPDVLPSSAQSGLDVPASPPSLKQVSR